MMMILEIRLSDLVVVRLARRWFGGGEIVDEVLAQFAAHGAAQTAELFGHARLETLGRVGTMVVMVIIVHRPPIMVLG